ncbi:DNA recombination protein RmuC [Rarobacter incanus]|uniref:DNA recombination protein RmuC n=1 Tax=Rarobacter incanus TaxID=153494 RepID=A0A542SNE6_9MICO|nr:DNA recombination protein RmuC [Rarobacter incanus]TQK76159.1 DNA recombination protein RmuC [Rarobacter incanus]
METLIGIAVGLALGAVVGWFVGRSGSAQVRAELASQRQQAQAALDQAQRAAQDQLAQERAATQALLEQKQRDSDTLIENERRASREQAERTAAQHEALVERLQAAAQQRYVEAKQSGERLVEAERAAAAKQIEEMKADRKRLADEFEALSVKVLDQSKKTLLEAAEERFKRAQLSSDAELAKREQAIKSMVDPMTKTLTEVKKEVATAETSRREAHAALNEQLTMMKGASEKLFNETSQLVSALRAPQTRGRWGEIQLRTVVEAAGMMNHVDFDEQVSVDDQRPDMVVHLPGSKDIVVDAKVSFTGFLDAINAPDEKERAKKLASHARHVRNHVDQLGSKEYWEKFPSPEFVVMFLPAENFLQAALEQDPNLLEHSFSKNVVMATPATLVALLRTVAYTWRQEQLAANARQVFDLARELHKRLGTMGGHLVTMSKRLNDTVEAFNKFNSSLDRNVVTQARRFSELQGLTEIASPPPLEVQAVPAQKPDLYALPEPDTDA